MGKRKAADPLDPLSDRKKQRKRTAKPVSKPKKPFEEIDLLFEEVEAILNCSSSHNGAPPAKNALAHPGRIQDYFRKKTKDQGLDPAPINSGATLLTTHQLLTPPSNDIINLANDSVHRCGSSQVEIEGNIPNSVIPLSPVIKLISNIPCRNRFEVLAEDNEILRVPDPTADDRNKEAILCTPTPVPVPFLMHPSTEPSNVLILQRVEEVRSLVLQMAKCLQERLECGCKCNLRNEGANGGHIVSDPIPSIRLVQRGQATDHQKGKTQWTGSDGDAIRSKANSIQENQHSKKSLDEGDITENHIATNSCPPGFSNYLSSKSRKEIDNPPLRRPYVIPNASDSFAPKPSLGCSSAPPYQRTPRDPALLLNPKRPKPGTNILFLKQVPKLLPGLSEDHESRVNKVIHWLRHQRNCLSVIRSDIRNTKRWCPSGSIHDVISIEFHDRTLVESLILFNDRTYHLMERRRGCITLKTVLETEGQPQVSGYSCCNVTSNQFRYADPIRLNPV
ncbi:hypothetical protein NDU88_005870 [Pleurodeles waltl]|uniref:Uncharacterized protein n=1 Tax=Pleurodeles waltl TaxID=8319 RepID=A0AAV7NWI0_PLEWA|nr:hypothetical protein NDU88_005870 [Pleurodeles waltl]